MRAFPRSLPPCSLVNSELSSVSVEGFCRAMSLETNNHVDWFMQWEDYGDLQAFFLNAPFSRRAQGGNQPVDHARF